jgi:hypothetical protein
MRFRYSSADNTPTGLMPRLSMILHYGNQSMEVRGLLDTGAAINLLPYSLGIQLGAVWGEESTVVPLVGSLGNYEAHPLVLLATHPQLNANSPIRLAFAWIQTDDVPIIFGQMNFFLEFDVCFYRSQSIFEVNPKKDK